MDEDIVAKKTAIILILPYKNSITAIWLALLLL